MIFKMYVTIMPVILAGVLNMFFVKTDFYKRHRSPIDGGIILTDGKRLFGDNKTWAGFAGMTAFSAVAQILWGLICLLMPKTNYLYIYHRNVFLFNLLAGAALGLAYVLFELPNSFIKRRISIPEGKTAGGIKGIAFFVIDQVDSLFGVGIVLAIIYPMPLRQYFLYILLGALTHIAVNFILYKIKIRKNL